MAANVDTRKLKDSVAEFLRKSKFDKAADTLEQLVRAEPKDMTHRLKLGDTYRRLEKLEKAITCYQIAVKHFSDEGQLIKAIGAVKVILEIDPRNEMAQRELADMNNRRFAKPTLDSAGLRAPRGIGAGARGASALEIDEGVKATEDIAALMEDVRGERPDLGAQSRRDPHDGSDTGETLELDEPRKPGIVPGPPPRATQKPQKATEPREPPLSRQRSVHDLGEEDFADTSEALPADEVIEFDEPFAAPPARKALPPPPARAMSTPQRRAAAPVSDGVEIDMGEPAEEILELPLEAIIEVEAAASAAGASAGIELDLGEPAAPSPAAQAPAAPAARPMAPPPAAATRAMPPRPPPAPEILDEAEEILDLEEIAPEPPPRPIAPRAPAPPPGPPRPIADLLSSEAEEEIELLSISSDDEISAPPPLAHPQIAASGNDLDEAFGNIAPVSAAPRPPPRVPPPRVPLFDDLPQQAFIELVNRLSYKRFNPGELILKEGEPGRSFFVIIEGRVRVFKAQADGSEITLAHLAEGAFFGEMALLAGTPRTANVAAEDDTELLEVTDQVLREVVEKFPQVGVALKNFYRQRLLNNVMAISPLFRDFDPGERKAIVERFKLRQAPEGEVLIEEGKRSDGLYVVMHGAVRVEAKGSHEKAMPIARLREGDLFGEMSLLTRKPATATVTAAMNSILLKLPRENFQELVLTHPQILELVSTLTEQRKSATDAILQGHGPGIDGMAFV